MQLEGGASAIGLRESSPLKIAEEQLQGAKTVPANVRALGSHMARDLLVSGPFLILPILVNMAVI